MSILKNTCTLSNGGRNAGVGFGAWQIKDGGMNFLDAIDGDPRRWGEIN